MTTPVNPFDIHDINAKLIKELQQAKNEFSVLEIPDKIKLDYRSQVSLYKYIQINENDKHIRNTRAHYTDILSEYIELGFNSTCMSHLNNFDVEMVISSEGIFMVIMSKSGIILGTVPARLLGLAFSVHVCDDCGKPMCRPYVSLVPHDFNVETYRWSYNRSKVNYKKTQEVCEHTHVINHYVWSWNPSGALLNKISAEDARRVIHPQCVNDKHDCLRFLKCDTVLLSEMRHVDMMIGMALSAYTMFDSVYAVFCNGYTGFIGFNKSLIQWKLQPNLNVVTLDQKFSKVPVLEFTELIERYDLRNQLELYAHKHEHNNKHEHNDKHNDEFIPLNISQFHPNTQSKHCDQNIIDNLIPASKSLTKIDIESIIKLPPTCILCGKSNSIMTICDKCNTCYCSKICQTLHQHIHKYSCWTNVDLLE